MKTINELLRPNISNMKAYSSARDEFSASKGIFLDANESPYGNLNRYPDPYHTDLRNKLSKIKAIEKNRIFCGNGSDEIIDLVFRIFCQPGKDKALTFSPSYGMYEVSAAMNDVELVKIPLNDSFQIDFDLLDSYIKDADLKLLLICSPNNPSGNSIKDIEKILAKFNGIVVLDEAYIDFSSSDSFVSRLAEFPNLIITQTFSKAFGLAAARIGVSYANPEIIQLLYKVKPPYNISQLNQDAALNVLENYDGIQEQIAIIIYQRGILINQLNLLDIVVKIYPSDANFLLVEFKDAESVYNYLLRNNIITRNRNSLINNCLRITIGADFENSLLLETLKKY